MLEVCKSQEQRTVAKNKPKDIIVVKYETKTDYDQSGNMTVKRVPKKVNVTKMVNESKKLIKRNNAAETLAQLEKIFTKEGKK